ncbi:hypothetical protein DB811_02735 [Xanthomonas perforans]|uniref:Uncharacterized protein n=1 Tax=Xanthomonas perforans TaxID=442694 RepID=A0AAQ0YX46_XANPE|nr:hypothetical protein BJD11_22780 [Xanthomonas euvesicatoria]APP00523.1 hypothetical protein BJD13_16830 [Xanthomonas perforans]AQS76973.1 hypothetical protein XPE_12485 [Xanthomonas perforans 91-118]AYO97178.1 hypothetical protein Xcom_00165 [Xanthomonas axonopodis pv. commiphoreae]OQP37991.1 hypothetical protein IB62_012910 [Xanthomonas euvesicatoria]
MGCAHGKTPGGCCVVGKARQQREERVGSLKRADVALLRQCVLPGLLRTRAQRHDAPCACSHAVKSAPCA